MYDIHSSEYTHALYRLSKYLYMHTHSAVVKVKRQCLSGHQWTSVDFSGCTLSSNEEQAFIMVSLWTSMISTDPDPALVVMSVPYLEKQVKFTCMLIDKVPDGFMEIVLMSKHVTKISNCAVLNSDFCIHHTFIAYK